MNNENLSFREFQFKDKKEILELFKKSFAKSQKSEKDEKLWNWQMIKNPDGKPFIGLAIIKNKIVGHYAIIPYNYLTEKGEKIKIGLVVDVMVHPNYHRKGIFLKLSKYSLKEAVKRRDIQFTIGYPFTGTTYNSVVPGHLKVGWALRNKLFFYLLPIKLSKIIRYRYPILKKYSGFLGKVGTVFLNLRKILNKLFFYSKVKHSENNETIINKNAKFSKSDLKFINEFSQGKFIKKMNLEFLNWRFSQKPNSNYILIKIKTSKITKSLAILSISNLNSLKVGVIIIIISKKTYYFDILHECITYLKKANCDSLVLIDYKNSIIKKARKYFGFINTFEYYQIINWKKDGAKVKFPIYPLLNFIDFDIF